MVLYPIGNFNNRPPRRSATSRHNCLSRGTVKSGKPKANVSADLRPTLSGNASYIGSAKALIEAIGESLIRDSLRELYLIKFKDDDIQREIERLQRIQRNRK